MAGSSREALIDAATSLFYEHGFHAVGIDRIIDEVGVTKTTFYNHFESKDDLIIAVLRRRDDVEMRELLAEIDARGGSDLRARILGLFDALHDWFHDEGFRGCIFMNAAVEFPSPNDPVHHAAAAHGANIDREIRAMLEHAPVPDPDMLAHQLSMLIAGALITRHVAQDTGAARVARAAAEALLDRAGVAGAIGASSKR